MAMSVDVVVEKVEPTSVEPSIEVMTGVVSEVVAAHDRWVRR